MNRNDKTWAQLNRQPKHLANQRKLVKQPIGYINKQNYVLRALKTLRLYCTTYYSLKISWYMAAR